MHEYFRLKIIDNDEIMHAVRAEKSASQNSTSSKQYIH